MATGPFWTENSGKSLYAANSAHRDVLIIVSECQPGPEVVLRRPACELTEEWREKLENQGIAREHQDDDLSIVKARYARDSNYTISSVKMSGSEGEKLTRDSVLDAIKAVMSKSENRGVCLYYIGAGKRYTGDWCFEDGFITFRDLAQLYLQLLRGRVLSIVSDCSHSGSWVKECMTFLDEQGIEPCGHSARDKGILINVSASCLTHQVPRQLAYSIQGLHNNCNTGILTVFICNSAIPIPITDCQHAASHNFTILRCGAQDIDEECLCLPQATWQAWRTLNRVVTVYDIIEDKWILLLVADDEETITALMDAGFETYNDYGQVLKVSDGVQLTYQDYYTATLKYTVYHTPTNLPF